MCRAGDVEQYSSGTHPGALHTTVNTCPHCPVRIICWMRTSALMLLAVLRLPALLLAQNQQPTGNVIATVRSKSGAPLAEAEVRTDGQQTLTDPQGIARLTLPYGRHRLTVARIGFEPATIVVQVPSNGEVSVTVTLEPAAYQLDSVT